MGTKKKKRILIVHNYYQIPGGEDTVVSNEKEMLKHHGHVVILYSRKNSELQQMSKFHKLLLPFIMVFNIRTYFDVKKIIREQKIDIVHVHNTLCLISPAVYYAARSMKIPIIQTIHNFRLLCPGATFYRDGHICEDCIKHGLTCAVKHSCYRKNKLQTLACVMCTKIHRLTGIYAGLNYICLTEFNKEKLLSLKQIKPEKVYIKPNFTYDIGLPKNNGEYYLYIGRIEEIKGISLLIDAFSKMPDKHLILAGTGLDLENYKMEITQKRLDNISFIGFVNRKQLARILGKAKAVIVSSQWYETFGMIIIESFASHTPVIVGNIGNVGALVEDGFNGIKYLYNSPSSLVQAINKFERMDIQVMGENAYRTFQKKYNEKNNYKILNDIYNDILSVKK